MSKKDIIEDNRIKEDKRSSSARRNDNRRQRNIQLAVACAIFSIIIIIGTAFVVVHSLSDKEKLREEGIAAFKSGNYNEAINDFKASLELKQWFSEKMDIDTKLYMAASYMRNGDYLPAHDIYNEFIIDNNPTSLSNETLQQYEQLASALDSIKSGNINEKEVESLQGELEKGNKSVNLFLGLCYQQMGMYDEMLQAFNEYTDNFGMNTYVSYQLSSYYLDNNDVENAVTMINKGLACSDDLYKDKIMFNDIVVSETKLEYGNALDKAQKLIDEYPDNDIYQSEYDFLYSRINMDTEPVHTKTDAE